MSQAQTSVIPFVHRGISTQTRTEPVSSASAMKQLPFPATITAPWSYRHINFEADDVMGTLWCQMRQTPRPSFTPELLSDLLHAQAEIKQGLADDRAAGRSQFRNFVLSSATAGTFSLGGDLRLFESLISSGDREALTTYAHRCIDLVFGNIDGYGDGLLTVALVKGSALGGGFEAALSCHVIVAERSAKFGLPEIMFNLFPGMGAYNFLCRRVSPAVAERIILSGQIYSATALHELGIVDVVAEDGAGDMAVTSYIQKTERRALAHRAMRKVRQACQPITRDDLIKVTDLWVEAALSVGADDLRQMRRLVAAQERRSASSARLSQAAD